MSNGTGLNQDGSLRAQNIKNEDNNAALELHLITLVIRDHRVLSTSEN